MTEPLSSDLLARYLSGDAAPEVRAVVAQWAATDPRHEAELERLRAAWTARPDRGWDVDRAWSGVAARLDAEPAAQVDCGRRRPVALALAATVLLALGAAIVWQATRTAGTEASRIMVTTRGERQEATLDDGSRVILAPGSRLVVESGYGGTARRLTLEGEAWFEVRHVARRPFQVRARGTVTEDLGTSFAIRARADASAVRVVLVTGSASFGREGDGAGAVTLTPGAVAELLPGAGRPVVEQSADASRLVAWREGRLEFLDAPVSDVLAELGRWYAVEFRLADPALGGRRVTHTFAAADLPDALEVLGLALGVRIERQGDVVILR